MDVGDGGRGDGPLVPHLVVRGAAPEVEVERRARGAVERLAQREVDREPGEHVGCVGGGVRGEADVAVELRVKVAGKAMAHGGGGVPPLEAQVGRSRVVDDGGAVRVGKGEDGPGARERREAVQLDDVGRLKVFEVIVCLQYFTF